MTRIFTDGAEMGDVKIFTIPESIAATTSVKRNGSYSYQQGSSAASKILIPDTSEFYFRAGVYFDALRSGYAWFNFFHGITSMVSLQLNTNYKIVGYVGAGLVTTGSATIAADTWYLIETYVKIDDSPNGRLVVKIDGNVDIDFTGDTKTGTDTHVDYVGLYKHGSAGVVWFDDLALNDTNDTKDNSWCGEGGVYIITPSGSGITNDWLNSGSTSGSSNYTYVDAFPYDSGSYVYFSGSLVGTQDQYKMTPFTIPHKNIRRIFPEARARKSIADTTTMKLGYLPSGWTDQISGSLTLTTSETRVVGNEAIINPATSASWTKADIDALEFIVEI